jgi:hypothetical protein
MFKLNQLLAHKRVGNRIKFRILVPLVVAACEFESRKTRWGTRMTRLLLTCSSNISRPRRSLTACIPIAIAAALFLPPPGRAQEEENHETNIVEPILTEETLPNEPRERSLRSNTDYRKNGSEMTAEHSARTMPATSPTEYLSATGMWSI